MNGPIQYDKVIINGKSIDNCIEAIHAEIKVMGKELSNLDLFSPEYQKCISEISRALKMIKR